ncbi:MAG: GTPase [Bacillota bacterium]|jgi:ribosome biogenesis GTPase A|nr:ribosome biogenesis GTPase YlqF [Candidatus Fermentithermobacillaceae bacterium]
MARSKGTASRKTHPGLPAKKALDLVDVFLFLADARIPLTSVRLAEPYLSKRRRIYVLTKPDLADPEATSEWTEFFASQGSPAFAVNCKRGDGLSGLLRHLKAMKAEIDAKKPSVLLHRPLRIMLFGPPNVGKSSLANRLLGTTKAPFGAKPGLTRSSNWLKGRGFLEILDTPGVVDTSLVKGEAQLKLAAAWAIPENRYDPEEVARYLVEKVAPTGKEEYLEEYGRARGFIREGGAVDIERTCKTFIQDFREGRLGRFTLEAPGELGG